MPLALRSTSLLRNRKPIDHRGLESPGTLREVSTGESPCHRASGRVEVFPPLGLPEGPQVLLSEILGNATIPAVEVEAPAALVKADGGHQAAYSEQIDDQ